MTPRDPAESHADRRRVQMLEAAAALISERGFADTRISDVAERAGVSSALVLYYFDTKDALLSEALRHSERMFDKIVSDRLSGADSLRDRLQVVVDLSCRPSAGQTLAWGLWIELWAQALHRPEIAAARLRLDDDWRAVIGRLVAKAVEAGEIPSVDVADFVVAFAALLDGLLIQVVLGDSEMDSDRAASIAMSFAATALHLS